MGKSPTTDSGHHSYRLKHFIADIELFATIFYNGSRKRKTGTAGFSLIKMPMSLKSTNRKSVKGKEEGCKEKSLHDMSYPCYWAYPRVSPMQQTLPEHLPLQASEGLSSRTNYNLHLVFGYEELPR